MHINTAEPGSPARARFNWTKIHLVYFALAGFDLIAIVTGFMLSEWSRSAHEETVQKVNQTAFLHDHIRTLQNYAISLASVSNRMMETGDIAVAKVEIGYLESAFGIQLSDQTFRRNVVALDADPASGRPAKNGNLPEIDLLQTHLIRLSPLELDQFTKARTEIKRQIATITDSAKSGLKAIEAGNASKVVALRQDAEVAMQDLLRASNNISAKLDNSLRETVNAGKAVFKKSSWLQTLAGLAIFVMIAGACTYAHLVGKVLKRKYRELEKAHADATSSSEKLRAMNAEVTTLNIDLAANITKLRDAQDELVKKGRMEQLGQLTATVAHELRNPLGGVRTSAYLLERKLAGKDLGVEPQLQRISNGIIRCDNIITQLLDFSRTQQVNTELSNLDQWLEALVQEQAQSMPGTIKVDFSGGLRDMKVPFDAARLQRAIINLLNNATEALGSVKSEDLRQEIRITTALEDGMAAITISDNGPGMTPEVLKRVREPLFTTKNFGTGLGVPAIEQIAMQHGGSLNIESQPGQGATFTLRLPLAQAEALAA